MKPLQAYAVVKRKNPKLNILEIYDTDELVIEKDEQIIKIEIRAKINANN